MMKIDFPIKSHLIKQAAYPVKQVLLIGVIIVSIPSLHAGKVLGNDCTNDMHHRKITESLQKINVANYYRTNTITDQELKQELSSTSSGRAQADVSSITAEARWNYFRSRVHAGKNIIVHLRDGRRLRGKLKEVNENELVLMQDNQETRTPKQEIAKVKKQRKLLKTTLIGFGIGLGAGFILGVSTECHGYCEDNGLSTFLGVTLGPIFGTAGGLFTGLVRGGTLYP